MQDQQATFKEILFVFKANGFDFNPDAVLTAEQDEFTHNSIDLFYSSIRVELTHRVISLPTEPRSDLKIRCAALQVEHTTHSYPTVEDVIRFASGLKDYLEAYILMQGCKNSFLKSF